MTWLLLLATGCVQTPATPTQTATAATDVAERSPTDLPTVAPTNTPPLNEPVPSATVIGPTTAPSETESPTAAPTASPTVLPPPSATPSPQPTAEPPTPIPTPTPELILPEWLTYLNRFRGMSGVPPINELAALTLGSRLHSQYMTVNDDPIAHWQDPGNALYDPVGDLAARNGNIFATNQTTADFIWSINFWASAPFHLIPMLAPGLERVGYGDFIDSSGGVNMAAVLDVRSQRNRAADAVTYPIMFPGNGSATWIVRHSMTEWPDPLSSCPGFSRPTGAPIILQLGSGNMRPSVGHHVILVNGEPLQSCIFDETTYYNPNDYAEETGRKILDEQDAIVIIPRNPLIIEQLYTVQIEVNGELYFWEFTTQRGPEG